VNEWLWCEAGAVGDGFCSVHNLTTPRADALHP
jgi:hypothetical protein